MTAARLLPLAFALLLAACQPGDEAAVSSYSGANLALPSDAALNATSEDLAGDGSLEVGEQAIAGNASYLEHSDLPDGATLLVQLLDQDVEVTGDAVLATTRLASVKGPEIAFELPYDPADIRPGGRYGLHATLTDANGELLYATDTEIPVEPGSNQTVNFRLLQVGDEQLSPHLTHWQCGDLRLDAEFHQSDDTATLRYSGRKLRLPIAMSGSGARYADEAGNEFWTKGDTSTLTLSDQDVRDCGLADQPSPWTTAAERDLAFRAVGNEPGWMVEVSKGDTPAMSMLLDYGERKLQVTQARTLDDGLGFIGEVDGIVVEKPRGKAPNRRKAKPVGPGSRKDTGAGQTAVELRIHKQTCLDGMSGESFPARATLKVGDTTYQGCGAMLSR